MYGRVGYGGFSEVTCARWEPLRCSSAVALWMLDRRLGHAKGASAKARLQLLPTFPQENNVTALQDSFPLRLSQVLICLERTREAGDGNGAGKEYGSKNVEGGG